jgi:2-amino-4-hydroxy-6-hydroxymethyldihydropteridine diphosphokinase
VNAQKVFFSLGSNLGERQRHLRKAIAGLSPLVEAMRVSSLYQTDPLYLTAQPRFLNIVATGLCRLPPQLLLDRIQELEAKLGRDRRAAVPKGPRVIDIDILLYGNLIVDAPGLQSPHPGLRERQFVLVPLLELDPDVRDPHTGRPYAEVSQVLGSQGVYMVGPWAYTESSGET